MQKNQVTWWQGVVAFVFAFLRIRCHKPRLPSGTASMAPKVIRDRLEHFHCDRWKHHIGPCASERPRITQGGESEMETETWE